MGKVATDKDAIVSAMPAVCSDERLATEFIEKQRWGDHPWCPKCGFHGVYQMKGKDGQRQANYRWRCRQCHGQYTVRKGTVLEDSPIPLRVWCYAFWRASTSKKGVSALEIKRQTGLSYKSALFMLHRIRYALAEEWPELLKGPVEIDETFVQGQPRKIPKTNKTIKRPRQPVLAMVERKGQVRVQPLSRVTAKNLAQAIYNQVDIEARILTDEAHPYRNIAIRFKGGHGVVMHHMREYLRPDPKGGPPASINTAESFFALLKRSLHGIYHSVSPEHLHRYLAERQFTYNTRGLDDGERTALAIKWAEGKRLTYREQVSRGIN